MAEWPGLPGPKGLPTPLALVRRTRHRTLQEYFFNFIRPRQEMFLNDFVQQVGVAAKREHTYRNRTGALEGSVAWEKASIVGDTIRAAIQAGGPSKVRFAIDITTRRETKRRVRNIRGGLAVRRGQIVFVNYASPVEKRGYTVLTSFVKRYLPLLRSRFGHGFKVERV